jgi:hypothetical protein
MILRFNKLPIIMFRSANVFMYFYIRFVCKMVASFLCPKVHFYLKCVPLKFGCRHSCSAYVTRLKTADLKYQCPDFCRCQGFVLSDVCYRIVPTEMNSKCARCGKNVFNPKWYTVKLRVMFP